MALLQFSEVCSLEPSSSSNTPRLQSRSEVFEFFRKAATVLHKESALQLKNSRKFYHAQTPHLVPECVVLSLPHLHCNFLAPGAINLVNHWNNYEDHGGMVNSKPSFGRQVCRRCLSSVVDLHLRCGPAQHRPFACTLPQTYREKNFKLLLSICLKFIQHISSLLLLSDEYISSSPQEHCLSTVHQGNQAEEVFHARKFSITYNQPDQR